MQELTIVCDFCDQKFKLVFPATDSDPIVCPFCATGLEQEILLGEDEKEEGE